MANAYAVLSCNGLDKCAGCVAGEVAKQLYQKANAEVICPVFYRVSPTHYQKALSNSPLLVVDGCATRCASKLATEYGLKISQKINVTEIAKKHEFPLSANLELDETALKVVDCIIKLLLSEQIQPQAKTDASFEFPAQLSYQTYTKDKFVFRLPENKGFYFNENDIWAYVNHGRARIGVNDFAQKSLSDILFYEPSAIGTEVQQFDEVGTLESGKAVFELISPVSGRVTAVNQLAKDAPELVNKSPYEDGWLLEIELADFEEDQDLLHQFGGYFPIMKRKVDAYHV